MRILIAHNAYQQAGGEDAVAAAEADLLRSHGHEVAIYSRHNDEIGTLSKVAAASQTFWSGRTVAEAGALFERFRPDVLHVHNTFPLISPSLYWAASRAGVPVVQTLHNFRLMCLNALFLRDGRLCEDCMARVPWRGVGRACFRGSHAASATLAGMLVLHRLLGTWRHKVTRYIALNEFSRSKFIDGGLPEEKIVLKPNFVDSLPPEPSSRDGLLFVGRLSAEKGLSVLAQAMAGADRLRVRVAGEGPESGLLDDLPGATRLGKLSGEQVQSEMSRAIALVVPSICYENFPRTIAEAFANRLPVIASRIGALAEIVSDGKTGLLFEAGNPADFARKMTWALDHPKEMAELGRNARKQYETEYSAEVNYRLLIAIYQDAMEEVKANAGRTDHRPGIDSSNRRPGLEHDPVEDQ